MIAGGRRAVALLSGGLDSVVSLARATDEMDVRLVLFFNYGQRALARERSAVLGVVNFYHLPLREVELDWLGPLSPEGMRLGGEADDDAGSSLRTVDSVWIPNRNGVFLNVAASFAESFKCDRIVTGFNREEAVEFPDNRPEYVSIVNRGLELSTRTGVQVVSFTQDLDKRDILKLGAKLGAPLSVIWSCYEAGEFMCGRCSSCRRLKIALDGVPADIRPPLQFTS
ncbi:MAG: 7-cyano-7-deazaguanine synthase [Candidatus Latescibacterota bacterium]|nr:MAG: 7-cyano-7-deazaguanine synthase [Candidatus Latescibacterota bacterium]